MGVNMCICDDLAKSVSVVVCVFERLCLGVRVRKNVGIWECGNVECKNVGTCA